MASTTVRLSERSRRTLRELAELESASMQAILDRALEEYRRRRLLDGINKAYERLRADEGVWRVAQAEDVEWERTLADGLEEPPAPSGRRRPRKRRSESTGG